MSADVSSNSSRRVVIRGVGLISPIGHSAWGTFASLLAGQTMASRARKLPDDADPVYLIRSCGGVGLVRHSTTDPAVELAERSAREALHEAGDDGRGIRTFIGTSKGAVGALTAAMAKFGKADTRHAQREAIGGMRLDPPVDFEQAVALGPHGYLNNQLRRRLPVGDIRHSVAACASSLVALHEARHWLQRDEADDPVRDGLPRRALVVTSEAALLPVFVHSYTRLGVLAPLTPEGYQARPLDAERGGFMLAELGAAVVLEALPPGQAPASGQLELVDTAAASESYDMIRPAPGMPALSRIARQLFAGRSIDMLHPHAPGTQDHDAAELQVYADCLDAVVDRHAPLDTYACKGAVGHGLGSAGLVALVLAGLCARTNKRPPMPWLKTPLDEVSAEAFRVSAEPPPVYPKPLRSHAIFAAGFGGHCAGAVIRRSE